MKSIAASTVTVVGLGLMGGSIAGALRGRCQRVIGVDRDPLALDAALHQGLVDHASSNLEESVTAADVTILATPVRAILRLLGEIAAWLPEQALVMDLGSTKAEILEAMRALPEHVEPLGGHPMCGKETSGIAAADVALFRGRTFILSPLARTSGEAVSLGEELVRAIGATPLIIDGARQDYLVGTLSHLPYLLACALVSTADATTSADPLAWQIIAGGFRDTSRVAGSDVTMMVDILTTNRDQVVKAARECEAQLRRLIRLVEEGDEARLRQALVHIRDTRREMYS
jgi:prephenate dehydrogenase